MEKEKRVCRKCKNNIPACVVIDGKRRNLKNRKFCLICSPFGSHNRMVDDPDRLPLSRRFKDRYKLWSDEQKQNHKDNIKERGNKRKKYLLSLKGGKCIVCGYNREQSCLDFHHIDPSKKSFEMTTGVIRSKNIEDVLLEVKKCVILCCRCHQELHKDLFCLIDNMPETKNSNNKNAIDLLYLSSSRKNEKKIYKKKCVICKKVFETVDHQQIFCSKKCYGIFQRQPRPETRKVNRPSKKKLLKEVEESNYCAVGRKYGVTDNAIRKWLK